MSFLIAEWEGPDSNPGSPWFFFFFHFLTLTKKMIEILTRIRVKITIIKKQRTLYFIIIYKYKEVPLSLFSYRMLTSTFDSDKWSSYYKIYVYGFQSIFCYLKRCMQFVYEYIAPEMFLLLMTSLFTFNLRLLSTIIFCHLYYRFSTCCTCYLHMTYLR